MSEQEAAQPRDDGPDQERPDEAPETGNPAVDEVLRSLRDLPDRPVDEHVGVFEQAHETLRRTLNDAGQQD